MSTEIVKTYQAVPGSRLTDADAAILGPVIDALPKRTADALFTAALPEDSPLHPYFEWDKEKTFAIANLTRASYLLRSVMTVPVSVSYYDLPQPVMHRAFVPVVEQGERVYVTIENVLESPDLKSQYAEQCRRYFLGGKSKWERFRHFTEFEPLGPLFAALDALEKSDTP